MVDTEAPTSPANLKVDSKTDKTATLSWDASQDNVGVSKYKIYQAGSKMGESITSTFTSVNLAPSTDYTFTVKAVDAAGNASAESNAASAITEAVVIDETPVVIAIDITPIAADGKTVSGIPKISVNPTDDKGITKVEFYTKAVSSPDSTYYKVSTVTAAPYSANWATSPWVADGEYTIKVVVYDIANQTATLTRNVIVNNTILTAL